MTSADYNLLSPGACLTGFWEEERCLKHDGYESRVYGKDMGKADSFERVMPRCRQARTMLTAISNTHAQQESVLQPSNAPKAAPRGALLQATIAAEANEFVASLSKDYTYRGPVTSETRSRYHKPYDVEAYGVAQGLAATRNSKMSPNKGAPPPAPGAAITKPSAYGTGHFLSAPPVTAFCSRLPELVFPFQSGSGRGGVGPGMEHAVELHGPEKIKGLPYHLLAPGAELTLAPLFQRLVNRLREGRGMSLADFVRGLQSAAAEGALEKVCDSRGVGLGPLEKVIGPINPYVDDPAFVRADVFRMYVHTLRIQLSDVDLEAVVRMCAPLQKPREVPVVSLSLLERVADLVKVQQT